MVLSLALSLFTTLPTPIFDEDLGRTNDFSISADGSCVATIAQRTLKRQEQLIFKDFRTNQSINISSYKGADCKGTLYCPVVTNSGDAVGFITKSQNLGAEDVDQFHHVFVWDRNQGCLANLTLGFPKEHKKDFMMGLTLADHGKIGMVRAADTSTGMVKLWVLEQGKKPVSLAERLHLAEPKLTDYNGTISPDGKRYYAIVTDPIYNDGKPLDNPIMITGSFDSDKIKRVPLATFDKQDFRISNLKISANGLIVGWAEGRKKNGNWLVTNWIYEGGSVFFKILQHQEPQKPYYVEAFTLSGNGQIIVYQTNPTSTAKFGDQLNALNWKNRTSEFVSVSSSGTKAKDPIGFGEWSTNSAACNWDCSLVFFTSSDTMGAFKRADGGVASTELIVRDLKAKTTTALSKP